jgi:hypothetical protein
MVGSTPYPRTQKLERLGIHTDDFSDFGSDDIFDQSTYSSVGLPAATPSGDALVTENDALASQYIALNASGQPGTFTSTLASNNLAGPSLATVTPNPQVSSIGTNSSASEFQALDGVFSQFGGVISDLVGGSGGTATRTVVVPVAQSSNSSSLTLLLLVIGGGLVLYLILKK